jgi:hypothetical protein
MSMWPWVQPTSVGPLAWSQPSRSRVPNVACPPDPQPPPSLGKARDKLRESSILCLRRTGVRALQESEAAQAHRNAHATRTSRPVTEQSEAETVRGSSSQSSAKNDRFRSLDAKRPVNRTDRGDEHRQHYQAPAPQGRPMTAEDGSPG